MKIAMLQIQVQEDVKDNLNQVQSLAIQSRKEGADILVLPEMWNCPYINEQIKKSVSSYDLCKELLQTLSDKLRCIIVGGTIAHKIEDKIYNECLIFDHGKLIASYAKTHLFEVHTKKDYQEKDVFTPGDHLQTFDTRWGKMGVLICYDIRFPEVARLLAIKGTRIIFCPAAFNKSVTLQHWIPLFQVRAMENQVFMVGVNPAHYQYDTFESYGHSIITDPFGKICYQMDEKEPYSITDIDLERIDSIRQRMPFWKIRRNDLYMLMEVNENERNSNP